MTANENNSATQAGHVVISSYSRADALCDGALVDVTESARRVGFKCPLAVTDTVWRDCVEWDSETSSIMQTYQDEMTRLGALLRAAMTAVRDAIRRDDHTPQQFYLNRVAPSGSVRSASLVELYVEIHGGDNGELVCTIMSPQDR